jgi:hypothetical protein
MGALEDLLAAGTGGWSNMGNSITLPDGATTGQSRVVIGGDLPQELQDVDITAAILFYAYSRPPIDAELGYGFIGAIESNNPIESTTMMQGNVRYPIPGDPSSATAADVAFYIQQVRNIGPDDPNNPNHIHIDQQIGYLGQILCINRISNEMVGTGQVLNGNVAVELANSTFFFDKQFENTSLDIEMFGTAFAATAGGFNMTYGINIEGTSGDVQVGTYAFNGINDHETFYGSMDLAGIPIGSYEIHMWARCSLTLRGLTFDANDRVTVKIREVG